MTVNIDGGIGAMFDGSVEMKDEVAEFMEGYSMREAQAAKLTGSGSSSLFGSSKSKQANAETSKGSTEMEL